MNKKYNYTNFSKVIIDENIAYYLGLIWSDGYVNKDKIVLEILEEDFLSIKPIIDQVGEFRISTRLRKNRTKLITSCAIHSRIISTWFSNYDYIQKSSKSPDKILEYISSKYRPYFIKGYFDGDGCIYKLKDSNSFQLYFCGSYEQDWSFIEKIFKKLNIKSYKIIRRNQIQNNSLNKSSIVRITNKGDILKIKKYFPEIGIQRKTSLLNQVG